MVRKKQGKQNTGATQAEIVESPLETYVTGAMGKYAEAVIMNRAIPLLDDGMKPVQRRLLWQTWLSKLDGQAKHMKLAKLSGLVMAYHPHGTVSIDDTAVNLSQQWQQRLPLIDIYGNNGSVEGNSAAASRYIEARQTMFAQLMLGDLEARPVDFVDNFDGTEKEPVSLPAAIPWAVINGAKGIALGVATTILPHNPREIIGLMKLAIQNRLTVHNAKKIYNGPDFAGGGVIVSEDPWQDLVSPDVKYEVMAKHHVDGNTIVITELPPDTTTEQLIQSIVNLDPQWITKIDNETNGYDQVRIVLHLRRGTDPDVAWRVLCANSLVVVRLPSNYRVVYDRKCVQMGVLEMVERFVGYRKAVLRRVLEFKLGEVERKLAVCESEISLVEHKEAVLRGLRENRPLVSVIEGLTVVQEDHLMGLSLRRVQRLLNDPGEKVRLDGLRAGLVGDRDGFVERLGDGFQRFCLRDCDLSLKVIGGAADRRTGLERRVIESVDVGVVDQRPADLYFMVGGLQLSARPFKGSSHVVVPADSGVFVVLESGGVAYRRAGDVGDELLNRSIGKVQSDDKIVGVVPDRDGLSVLTVSEGGKVKNVLVSDLRPVCSTKRYLSTRYVVSSCAYGDRLVAVWGWEPCVSDSLVFEVVGVRSNKKVAYSLADVYASPHTCLSSGSGIVPSGKTVTNIKLVKN